MDDRQYFDFDVVKEKWNKYRLEDGTVLKLKIVVKKIFEDKAAKQISADWQQITTVGSVPSPIRGAPDNQIYSIAEINENIVEHHLSFDTLAEDWNEYQLHDDFRRFRVKYSPRTIHRTSLYDKHGEPYYSVATSIELMILPPKQ